MLSSTNKTEAKQLLLLGLPSIVAQLAQSGLGVIDTVMAGRHSAETLAAVALGNNLFHPVIVFVIGIMLVLNPFIAQYNGEENWGLLRRTFHNGIYLALFIAIPGVIIMNNLGPLLPLFDVPSHLVPLTDEYLKALAWGFPGLALFFAIRFTNEGLFATKVIMKVAISALPLNVLCNQWFINGGFGLQAMGPVGVGWATTVVYYYMFLALFIYTLISRRFRHIRLMDDWQSPDFAKIKEMLKVGIPMAVSIGLEVALFAAIGLMIGAYGEAAIASNQIAINISSVAYMMPLGLSMAITARVGYYIGKGNPQMSNNAARLGFAIGLLIMLVNVLILISIPEILVGFYTSDEAVVMLTTQLLFYAALFQFSDGIQVCSLGALRGLKDSKVPMVITGFAYWVIGFPSGYYVAEKLGWGIEGYWLAMITSLSIAAVLLTLRFIRLIGFKIRLQTSQQLMP